MGGSNLTSGRLVAVVLALLAAGCTGSRPESACGELSWDGRARGGSNVILIVSDTTRADRVGAHGGPARTPAYDEFARRNLLFDRAFAQSPWTKPSVGTLLTSLYPSQHGALSHPSLRDQAHAGGATMSDTLSSAHVTLAELLRSEGYRTAAIVSNPWMARGSGFSQGFEHYDDSFAAWNAPGEQVSQAALRWLDQHDSSRPFLLYLHYMDPHRPYPPLGKADLARFVSDHPQPAPPLPPSLTERISPLIQTDWGPSIASLGLQPSIELLEATYDGGIESFDRALGILLRGVRASPTFENTVVIVTSDHGEALFHRGYGDHGSGLFDDELAIPLAARFPGLSSSEASIQCPVGLIDVVPTLATYLGLEAEHAQGLSLLADPAEVGRCRDRPLISEGVMNRPRNRAVRLGAYKLLWQPDPGPTWKHDALYDVEHDPGETVNLLDATPLDAAIAATGERLMAVARDGIAVLDSLPDEPVELDAERLERLRSLGYLGP